MPEPVAPSPARLKLFSAVLFICAVWFVYVGATRPPGLNASPWVMYVLAVTWFAVGIRLLEMARGNPGRGNWIGFICCAGMGAVFSSIPFDGHPEACHSSSSFGFVSSSLLGDIHLCQGAFGAIGFFLIVIALVIAWRSIASRFRV